MWMYKTSQGLLRCRPAQSYMYIVFPKGHLHVPSKGSLSHSTNSCLHTCLRHQPKDARFGHAPLTCVYWARFLSGGNGNSDTDTMFSSGHNDLSSSHLNSRRSWKRFRRKAENKESEGDEMQLKPITEEELKETVRLIQEEKKLLNQLKSLQKQIDVKNVYLDVWDAKTDYLLTDEDLELLQKVQTRSPYSATHKKFIDVVRRADVEKRVIKKFGSLEIMQREKKRRERLLGYDAHYSADLQEKTPLWQTLRNICSKTGQNRVVAVAIGVNFLCMVFKFYIWMKTGSSSIFAEFLHSLGDLLNQVLLGYALYQAQKKPDGLHQYGYKNHLFIWPIVSGVGIFCFGFGLTLYHGLQGLFSTLPFTSLHLNYTLPVLFGSLTSEGMSLYIAYKQILRESRKEKISFSEYLFHGGEPLVKVVFLEDLVAVLGVAVCAAALVLSELTETRIYDSIGSLVISAMLGSVSTFLIQTNAKVLVGQSIPYQDKVKRQLEDDMFVHMVMDDKGTDLGDDSRFKAEVVFDGRRISLDCQQNLDLDALLKEIKDIKRPEQFEGFLVWYGVEVLDQLGYHIDRIEEDLKKSFPELKHIDIEPN